jgi:glyoxylase-like metal-dependent hydrolase (beta-lactamase superfamily II)
MSLLEKRHLTVAASAIASRRGSPGTLCSRLVQAFISAWRTLTMGHWEEVGDRVLVVRYTHLNQNIGLIVGDDADVVIDTRNTPDEAREIIDDIGKVSHNPIGAVVNTHGHSDHVFGNATFRPVEIWAHAGCAAFIRSTGERQRAAAIELEPELASGFADVVIDPPDRLIDRTTRLTVGGRQIDLLVLGRGHTGHDLVINVPDSHILFAGDQVVKNDAQYFGDAFPVDWPDTLERIASLDWSTLITGHGGAADRQYLAGEIERHRQLVTIAREGHRDGTRWEDLIEAAPYPSNIASIALARTYAQLEGLF